MTSFWRNRKFLAVAAVILGGAVAISYALAPEPVASSTLWIFHDLQPGEPGRAGRFPPGERRELLPFGSHTGPRGSQ